MKLHEIDCEELSDLFEMLRENGIQEFSLGDLSVKFGAVVHVPMKSMDDINDLIVDNKRQEDDDGDELLYYSAK